MEGPEKYVCGTKEFNEESLEHLEYEFIGYEMSHWLTKNDLDEIWKLQIQ